MYIGTDYGIILYPTIMLEKLKGNIMEINALYLIAGLLIFTSVLMVVAYIEHWRKEKKILNFISWFSNGMHANALDIKCWAGATVPTLTVTVADNEYWLPTPEQVQELIPDLHSWQTYHKLTRADYIPERKDCDDFSFEQRHWMWNALFDLSTSIKAAQKKAIGVGLFSFSVDGGGRHRIFFVKTTKGNIYYEIFPEEKNILPRKMSKKELASGYIII